MKLHVPTHRSALSRAFFDNTPPTDNKIQHAANEDQMSPFFRLPPEIRVIIYKHVLRGTEQPYFFIEHNEVWRCGPPPAFMRPGPPSLLLVNRLVAEEASQVLHEVREVRLTVISQGFPTDDMHCYHRFCSLKAFVPVLKRLQRLTLIVNTHPGHQMDEPYLKLLDMICTLLEQREVQIRSLRLILDCCFADIRRACQDDNFGLAQRFQALCPTLVEHQPWNAKCTWAKVKQTEGRYKRAAVVPSIELPTSIRGPGGDVFDLDTLARSLVRPRRTEERGR